MNSDNIVQPFLMDYFNDSGPTLAVEIHISIIVVFVNNIYLKCEETRREYYLWHYSVVKMTLIRIKSYSNALLRSNILHMRNVASKMSSKSLYICIQPESDVCLNMIVQLTFHIFITKITHSLSTINTSKVILSYVTFNMYIITLNSTSSVLIFMYCVYRVKN